MRALDVYDTGLGHQFHTNLRDVTPALDVQMRRRSRSQALQPLAEFLASGR